MRPPAFRGSKARLDQVGVMKVIAVYVTFPNMEEARKAAKHLAREKIIACANLFPCQSVYLWKNNLEESSEVAAVFKTFQEKYLHLERELRRMHSYETPAIFATQVDQLSSETLKWLIEVLEYPE